MMDAKTFEFEGLMLNSFAEFHMEQYHSESEVEDKLLTDEYFNSFVHPIYENLRKNQENSNMISWGYFSSPIIDLEYLESSVFFYDDSRNKRCSTYEVSNGVINCTLFKQLVSHLDSLGFQSLIVKDINGSSYIVCGAKCDRKFIDRVEYYTKGIEMFTLI